ncbi:MAG: hypothetical protein HN521_03280, partial [Candidatus Latescibacteria bacterium]|nr:hypothetical protein [Candidatus Latescibacterota bacterium]
MSTLWAPHTEAALIENTKYLTGFIFFVTIANHLRPQNISHLLTASTATGLFISILVISDFLGYRLINIPSAGLPSATLGYRNIAAMYLIQVLPFAMVLFALAKTRYVTLCSGIAIPLMGACIIYTRTRGAWLGLAIALLLVGFWAYWPARQKTERVFHKPKWQVIAICALLITLAFLPSGLAKQGPQSIDEKKTTVTTAINSILQKGGDRGRLRTWRNTLQMIQERPTLGVGLGNWSVYYPHYDQGELVTFQVSPERPHNTLLALFSEIGFIGLICFLWFWVATVKMGYQLIQSSDCSRRWIAAAGLTSFIAITIHSMFSFPFERATPTVFFWLIPGLFVVLQNQTRLHSARSTFSIPAFLLFIVIVQLTFTYQLMQFETHMYRAVTAERAANWTRVVTETKSALFYGTFHPEAVHLHGYALNALGNYNDSKEHYQKAVTKRPYDVQILNGLAIAAQNLNDTQTAKTRYRQILTIVNSSDIHYNLAGLFLQTGHPDSAITAYQQVIQMEGPSLDLYYHLTQAYLFNKQVTQATQTLQLAFSNETQAGNHF